MEKVLVTGLAIANDLGSCRACNIDFDWLISYPSVLLWANKIIITPAIDNIITNRNKTDLDKSIKLIFEIMKESNIIELVDPKDIMPEDFIKIFKLQVEDDRQKLASIFPESVKLGDDKEVPGQIIINGQEYCYPYLWSIYVSYVLARNLNAQCLFSSRAYNFSKYKFGLDNINSSMPNIKLETFHSILESYLPEIALMPHYSYTNKDKFCKTCKKEIHCKDSYLTELEINLRYILETRMYDEIIQLKEFISNTIDNMKGKDIYDISQIKNEAKKEEEKIKKKIFGIFPNIKRWTNVTTMVSLPITFLGLLTGQAGLALTGTGIASASQITNQYIEYQASKYRWIGVINRPVKAIDVEQKK